MQSIIQTDSLAHWIVWPDVPVYKLIHPPPKLSPLPTSEVVYPKHNPSEVQNTSEKKSKKKKKVPHNPCCSIPIGAWPHPQGQWSSSFSRHSLCGAGVRMKDLNSIHVCTLLICSLFSSSCIAALLLLLLLPLQVSWVETGLWVQPIRTWMMSSPVKSKKTKQKK